MSKLFQVHGLRVTGTEKQIEEYIADATQYDYIKNSLELISHKAEPKCKDNAEFIHAFRLNTQPDGTSRYLIAMTGKGDKNKPTFMIYSPSDKSFAKEIPIDMLTCLKNENYVEAAAERLSKGIKTTVRQLPEACEAIAYNMMEKDEPEL